MSIKLRNENGTVTEAVGYLDLGGYAVPRAELAGVLPDIERFERCLERAKSANEYMIAHSGRVPPVFDTMSDAERGDIAATLRELGMLAADAAAFLENELKARGGRS